MFEDINERRKLVDTLIKKINNEYQEHRQKFIDYVNKSPIIVDENTENIIETFSIMSTVLFWIKHNIIDNNGQIFMEYRKKDTENKTALFYISKETLNIINQNDYRFIVALVVNICKGFYDFNDLGRLFAITSSVIEYSMITKFERIIYQNEGN